MYKQKKVLNPETIRLTKKEKSGKSRLVLWAELMKSVFLRMFVCAEIVVGGCNYGQC
jgi:hypothetical protein